MNIKMIGKRAMLKLKKYAPELMVGAGILAGGAGVYFACKKTLAVESIVDEAKETLDKVHEVEERINNGEEVKYVNERTGEEEVITEKILKKDKTKVYFQTFCKLAKNYALPGLLFVVCLSLILGGFGIQKKRLTNVSLAYAGIAESYRQYRDRVKEKFGIDTDSDIFYDVKEQTNEETGEVAKTANAKMDDDSDYKAVFSRETAPHQWKNDKNCNEAFLRASMSYANQKLRQNGHLFLNEVYDMLGMPHTRTGALCGWVLGKGDSDEVCFNAQPIMIGNTWTYEPDFSLNFNCYGPIYDLI